MEQETGKRTKIITPDPARRKHLIEILMNFLKDKVSMAEMKGISREDLYRLAEAGYNKFKHGRYKEANDIYRGLIMLDHRNAYFHAVMGAIHQKQNRPIEAIMEYSQALKLNNKELSAYVNRGEVYLRHKNFKKAAQDFRNVILLDPVGSNLWANRARSLVIALKRSMQAEHLRKKRGRTVKVR